MKQTIFFFLLFFEFLGFSVLSAQDVVNENTDRHVLVEGTSLKMIPPNDFDKGQNFYGFQQVKTQSTIIVFQVDINFSKQTAGFTPEHLTKAGITTNSIKRFKLNEDSAVYVSAQQRWKGELYCKEILAIGNGNRTIVINAACLDKHKELVETLRKSLMSGFISETQPTSALELVDFSLNSTGTDLKLVDQTSRGLNALVYANKNIEGKPVLIATKSLMRIQDDPETFAKESIAQLGLIQPENTKHFRALTMEGMSGYESITTGKDKDGNNVTLYRVLLFTSTNYYYSFAGLIQEGAVEENIARFKKLLHTFKRH